tara:strand:- start:907 stop:1215 length:309 start_codon:yes stop_codon:yes gene_type:complete
VWGIPQIRKEVDNMIVLKYSVSATLSEIKVYKTLTGARNYAQRVLGKDIVIEQGIMVPGDGIHSGKIKILSSLGSGGCTIEELLDHPTTPRNSLTATRPRIW